MWLRSVYAKKRQEETAQIKQAKEMGIFSICFQGAVTGTENTAVNRTH